MRHGDPSSAETILRQMSHLYPGDPQVWTMLGLFEADRNRDAEGLADFDRALQLAPADAAARFFAARALHKLGRDQEALDQCRKALAIAPDSADARQLMEDISGRLSPR
jgi:tetratricopeptide (TPR) repeat protein